MTLADLRELFVSSRVQASTSAKFTRSSCPGFTCRYCGSYWIAVAGSKLDGHARCIVAPEFVAQLASHWRSDPTLSVQTVADALGVSPAIARSWCSPRGEAARDIAARRRP